MKDANNQAEATQHASRRRMSEWIVLSIIVAVAAMWFVVEPRLMVKSADRPGTPSAAVVSVSQPVQKQLESRLQFLGQFSPVEQVELRAQVGGTLTHIAFKDGTIVKAGDTLFEIDTTLYQIKLSQATAQVEKARTQVEKAGAQVGSARARFELASREAERAQTLQHTDAGTIENVEQRSAERQSAQAALDEAQAGVSEAEAAGHEADALVRDARFDLDHCRIVAPFTGRIGTHLVSVGNLISGSRGGGANTTLLATLVSLNPIYFNFDMSEADYMTFLRVQKSAKSSTANKVDISLSDENSSTVRER